MKYIKIFKDFNKIDDEERNDLIDELGDFGIRNFTINDDGSVDIDGSVDLSYIELEEIPFKFGRVTGNFAICHNGLKSLDGSPYYVGRDFECFNNKLTSLKGCPKEIGGNFSCSSNHLTSLDGSPEKVGGSFRCHINKITSLIGSPEEIGGDFLCHNNNLESLEGMPIEIGKDFSCFLNKNLKELNSVSNIEGNILCDKNIDTSKFAGYCKGIIKK